MSRRDRFEEPGATHHAVLQGNGRCRIVEDDADRRELTKRFAQVAESLGWTRYADCLVDTHLHLVVETPRPTLAEGVRLIAGGHARWFNHRHRREGVLFRPRFWSRRVRGDADLFRTALYVVVNPVAAGLCAHPSEWPWSSFRVTAHGAAEAFADGEERLLGGLGDSPAAARAEYREIVAAAAEVARARRAWSGAELLRTLGEMGKWRR